MARRSPSGPKPRAVKGVEVRTPARGRPKVSAAAVAAKPPRKKPVPAGPSRVSVPTPSDGGVGGLDDEQFLKLLEGIPEPYRHPFLRSRLTGQAVDLKLHGILGRRTIQEQLSGELDTRWREAVAKLGPEAPPASVLYAMAMTEGMPYREVKAIMETLLPYHHSKLAPQGVASGMTPEEYAQLIRAQLDAAYAEGE